MESQNQKKRSFNNDCFREDIAAELAAEIIPFEAQAWLPAKSRPATHPHKGPAKNPKKADWTRVLPEETHANLWKYFGNLSRPVHARDKRWIEENEKKKKRHHQGFASHVAAVTRIKNLFLKQAELWDAQANLLEELQRDDPCSTNAASVEGNTVNYAAVGSQVVRGLRGRLRDTAQQPDPHNRSRSDEDEENEALQLDGIQESGTVAVAEGEEINDGPMEPGKFAIDLASIPVFEV